jgi:hypothetical protein
VGASNRGGAGTPHASDQEQPESTANLEPERLAPYLNTEGAGNRMRNRPGGGSCRERLLGDLAHEDGATWLTDGWRGTSTEMAR